MANFELRIYVLDYENHEAVAETFGVTDVEYLTDKQFIEASEKNGRVYSLNGFLGSDVIAFDKDIVRAYFIDTEHEEAEPIRADVYNTTFHADLIKHGEQVKYIEVKPTIKKEPTSRTYTIIVTNNDTETSNDEVIRHIEDLSFATDVELIGIVDNKIRLQVETLGEILFDDIINGIEDLLGLSVELIDEEQHF